MRLKTLSAFVLTLGFAATTLAAPKLAVGPNAVVPDGAPLPAAYTTHDASCDLLGNCGDICPNPSSIFIGDMGYDIAAGVFYAIDVVTPDGIFTIDGSCVTGAEGAFAGVSQRGCAYDNTNGVIYTNSWNDQTIWYVDTDYNVIGSSFQGESFAGAAVDEANGLLYCSTNASPDQIIEYSINADASPTATGNRWDIPWQEFSDGYSAASLEYDDCSETFILVNQDANAAEYFSLDGGNLVAAGSCPLPASFAWGFGLDFASVTLKVADVAAFACDFPILEVEPDAAICGGGDVPDFRISYVAATNTFVNVFGGGFGAQVSNNTGRTVSKRVWLSIDQPAQTVPLGPARNFPAGSSMFYGGVDTHPALAPGAYSGSINIGDVPGGTPDASAAFSTDVVNAGIQ